MTLQEVMGLVATTGRQAREDVAGYFKPTTDLFNPNAIDPKVYRNIDQQPYTLKENQEARKFGAIRKLPITNKEILGRALKGGAGLGDVIPTSAIGTGALAGMAKVFHGSPHLFKKFRTDKIGTGEGAQAYGHGLYLAENPNVAKEYRDRLSGGIESIGGEPLNLQNIKSGQLAAFMDRAYGRELGIKNLERDTMRAVANRLSFGREKDYLHDINAATATEGEALEALRLLKSGKSLPEVKSNEYLYKVDLPDDQIKNMLDWDKPLSEQNLGIKFPTLKEAKILEDKVEKLAEKSLSSSVDSQATRDWEKAFRSVEYGKAKIVLNQNNPKMYGKGASGEDLYDKLSYALTRKGASKYLKEAGIPGIKYLDQGSRQAGKGTRNYVVFDERLPTIEEINSKVVTRKLR
jgi:plasmid stabilization system protein ParE